MNPTNIPDRAEAAGGQNQSHIRMLHQAAHWPVLTLVSTKSGQFH
jgi:hypothetical protein